MRWEMHQFQGRSHHAWVLADGTCLGVIDPETFAWKVFKWPQPLPIPESKYGPAPTCCAESDKSLEAAQQGVVREALPWTVPRHEACEFSTYLELMWDDASDPPAPLTFHPIREVDGYLVVNGERLESGRHIFVRRTMVEKAPFCWPPEDDGKTRTDYLHGVYQRGDNRWDRHVVNLHEGLYDGTIDSQIFFPATFHPEVALHLCKME